MSPTLAGSAVDVSHRAAAAALAAAESAQAAEAAARAKATKAVAAAARAVAAEEAPAGLPAGETPRLVPADDDTFELRHA